MKKSILILLLFCVAFSLNAEEKPVTYITSRHVDIAHRFEQVYDYTDGVSRVRTGSNYGAVDIYGRLCVSVYYDYISPFSEGLAFAVYRGKQMFIDKKGNVVVDLDKILDGKKVDYDIFCCESPSKSCENQNKFIDGWASIIVDDSAFLVNKFGEIKPDEKKTKMLKYNFLKCDYDYCFEFEMKNGMRKIYDEETQRYGYVNEDYDLVLPAIYEDLSDYEGDFCKAFDVNGNELYFDKEGNRVTKEIMLKRNKGMLHNVFLDYHYDRKICKKNSGYGFIDRDGNVAVECVYDSVLNYSYGLAAVMIGNKWGYIDVDGGQVIDFRYYFAYEFIGDVAPVWDRYGRILINRQGVKIADDVNKYNLLNDGFIMVNTCGKWDTENCGAGVIDYDGNVIIPFKYYDVRQLSNGYFVVYVDYGIYGLFDDKGKQLTDFDYTDPEDLVCGDAVMPLWNYDFINGYALACKGDSFCFIDSTGRQMGWCNNIIDCENYDDILVCHERIGKENIIATKFNGKWGYLDKYGYSTFDDRWRLVFSVYDKQ